MSGNKKNKVLCVVGARPNFIKIAPILEEFKKYSQFKPILVHTGQHYDYKMSEIFFRELEIPKPDYNLRVGSGSHAAQTAKVMLKLEQVILKENPKLVIVVGDVNSTLAAALVAVKLNIPVAHIEAGLRSGDMTMPEEINRILTDRVSDYLFVSDPAGIDNLKREGINKKKIFYVGNIIIDTLRKSKVKSQKSKILEKLNLKKKNYAVLTLHRPSNVDDKKKFVKLIDILNKVNKKIPIIFPVHPRIKKQLPKNIAWNCVEPLGYIDFLALLAKSKLVLTDSGGIQEETTVLKIPCLTLRENTERPITASIGTNTIVGESRDEIIKEVDKVLEGKEKLSKIPKYWDGRTAKRIIKIISELTL